MVCRGWSVTRCNHRTHPGPDAALDPAPRHGRGAYPPRSGRQAVEIYAATAEAVSGGGAVLPRNILSGSSSGGVTLSDGRQALAVDQVSFLKLMDEAVGPGMIAVGRRDPVLIPVIEVWREVCLSDLSLVRILARRGLSRSQPKKDALSAAIRRAAERVANAIAENRSPMW